MIKCCGLDSVWVENVKDKGYYFCKECKNEVTQKLDNPFQIQGGPDHLTLFCSGEPVMKLTQQELLDMIYENNAGLFSQKPEYIPQIEIDAAVKEELEYVAFCETYFS